MNDLDEARRRVEKVRERLPLSVSASALGVRSSAPYLLLCLRAALLWRTEELGRCACDVLARDDVAAGILLTRAVIESTAMMWRLKELLEDRAKLGPKELNNILDKMLYGWKKSASELPEALNVLTLIDRMDRQFLGIRERYDELSEFAHPNWCGAFGHFGATTNDDSETLIASKFGRDCHPKKLPSPRLEVISNCLNK
jgi:hypothetical protein